MSPGIRIFIVDDDALVRRSLCEVLSFEGYSCSSVGDPREALARLKETSVDIVISDMKMPGMSGLELLRVVREEHLSSAVIIMTGFGSIEGAVAAMREGATDYVTKPIIDDEIKLVIKRIAEERKLAEENAYLRQKLSNADRQKCCDIFGKSYKMQKIYDLIDTIAATKTTVLIRGKSGTGKRLVARAIHDTSPGSETKPVIEVSCGALPIFLDEIDAFTPGLQVKLLRVLQEGEFERVGETKTSKANARVIAATNQDLEVLIREGKFRNDLYYRLNIISIEIPQLRDRKEDISLLVDHFIDKHCRVLDKRIDGISEEALRALMMYDWPGNVRELENVIERACVLTKHTLIQNEDMPDNILKPPAMSPGAPTADPATEGSGNDGTLKDALKDPEKKIILDALKKTSWNKKEAAELLGINRTTLYKKLNQYGIDPTPKKS
jgi:DNA-binding NtrC family response regulator